MTLAEFQFAMMGFNELEDDRRRWQFFSTRKICYFIAKTQGIDIREEEIISIKELDEAIEESRRNDLPIVQVLIDGPDQQQ